MQMWRREEKEQELPEQECQNVRRSRSEREESRRSCLFPPAGQSWPCPAANAGRPAAFPELGQGILETCMGA